MQSEGVAIARGARWWAFALWVVGLASMARAADPVVDVMFVYTTEIERVYGGKAGVEALVQSAIFSANKSFRDSDCGLSIRRAGLRRVDYEESYSDMGDDLDRLRDKDGVMDEVHDWRTEAGADVVCLIRSDSYGVDSIGIAYQMQSLRGDPEYAFCAISGEYALSDLLLQHEVGHNLGAAHDRGNANATPFLSYAHGYRFTGTDHREYRTLMAYRPGIEINYFSNPDKTHQGVAMGVSSNPTPSDNARALRQTGLVISNYRAVSMTPPSADAGEEVWTEDLDGDGAHSVSLDGSGSFDWGEIVSWSWTWSGGSASGEIVDARFGVGRHEVTLTVTDDQGQRASDTVVVEIVSYSEIKDIYTGAYRMFYLRESGLAYATGRNTYGELGVGEDSSEVRVFTPVALGNLAEISVGGSHTLFRAKSGSLYAAGYDGTGQFGDGPNETLARSPVAILEGVASIAAGASFSVVAKEDGSVWTAGNGYLGPLGSGAFETQWSFTKVIDSGAVKVVAGSHFSAALKADGSLWASGEILDHFRDGAIDGTFERIFAEGVVDVAAGRSHLVVLKNDGSVWTIGDRYSFALGLPSVPSTKQAHRILESGVERIKASQDATIVQMADKTWWGAGGPLYNAYGKLGEQPRTLSPLYSTRVSDFWIGYEFVAIQRSSGAMEALGTNAYGAIGQGNSWGVDQYTAFLPAVRSEANEPPNPVILVGNGAGAADGNGDGYATATLDGSRSSDDWVIRSYEWYVDGERFGLGKVIEATLPVGELELKLVATDSDGASQAITVAVTVKPFATAESLASGHERVFVIRKDGSLWGMGNNNGGALGLAPSTPESFRWNLICAEEVASVASGYLQTLVLKKDGSLWGVGSNYQGSLGLGDAEHARTLTRILPSGVKRVAAYSGYSGYSCYVMEDGSLWGMGENINGRISYEEGSEVREPFRMIESGVADVYPLNQEPLALMQDGRLLRRQGGSAEEPFVELTRGVSRILGAKDEAVLFQYETGEMAGVGLSSSSDSIAGFYVGPTPVLLPDLGNDLKAASLDGSGFIGLGADGLAYGIQANWIRQEFSEVKSYEVDVFFPDGVVDIAGNRNLVAFLREDSSVWMISSEDRPYWRYRDSPFYDARRGVPTLVSKGEEVARTNLPPVAAAKVRERVLDLSGSGRRPVVLDGASSSDDRFVAEWKWTLTKESDGSRYGANGRYAWLELGAGRYSGELLVSDGEGLSSTDGFSLEVGGRVKIESLHVSRFGSAVILADGSVYGAGNNYLEWFGKMFRFKSNSLGEPLDVPKLKSLALGDTFLAGIAVDDTLWLAGENGLGQLGTGRRRYFEPPTPSPLGGVKDVQINRDLVLALKQDGSLWAVGANLANRLGLGAEVEFTENWIQVDPGPVAAFAAGEYSTLLARPDGSLWLLGSDALQQGELVDEPLRLEIDNVRDVYVGTGQIFVIRNDGSLWSAGWNDDGALGTGSPAYHSASFELVDRGPVSKLAGWRNGTFYLKGDGSLWGVGKNEHGRLGFRGLADGNSHPTLVFRKGVQDVAADGESAMVLRSDGSIFAIGYIYNKAFGPNSYYSTLYAWTKLLSGDGSWSRLDPVAAISGRTVLYAEGEFADARFDAQASFDHWQLDWVHWTSAGQESSGVLYEPKLGLGSHDITLEIRDIDGNASVDTRTVIVKSRADYEEWLGRYFSAGQIAAMENVFDDDPDSDGLSNRTEETLGLDPSEYSMGPQLSLVWEGERAFLRVDGLRLEAAARLMRSGGLGSWVRAHDAEWEWLDDDSALIHLGTNVEGFFRLEGP